MHGRLNQNDVSNRINVEEAAQVRDAVAEIIAAHYPGAELASLTRAFDDVHALFE